MKRLTQQQEKKRWKVDKQQEKKGGHKQQKKRWTPRRRSTTKTKKREVILNCENVQKKRKNGAQPKTKIIQTTSLLLDYNCIKNKSLDYRLNQLIE
jgi:hypothetical protein